MGAPFPAMVEPLRYDDGQKCFWQGNTRLPLTPKERTVLLFLMTHAGQWCSTAAIYTHAWGDTGRAFEVVKRTVRKIRKILGDRASAPRYIQSEHGSGYVYIAPLFAPQLRPEPLWDLPAPPQHDLMGRHFVGRSSLMAQLHAGCLPNQFAVQVLCGLAGVGKTRLVLEYVHRLARADQHAAAYDVVWWLRAEKHTTLVTDYRRLAQALQLPQHDALEPLAVVSAVHQWLTQHTGWLLLFDNAEGPEALRPFLPAAPLSAGTRHMVITSRNPHWRQLGVSPLEVPVLACQDAVTFLHLRTGQHDPESAAALATYLGCLPWALECAGAVIEALHVPFADYLAHLRTQPHPFLLRDMPPSNKPEDTLTMDASLWTSALQVWQVALEKVERISPRGAELLRLCAFFAPDRLPQALLASTQPLLALYDALELPLRYALIQQPYEQFFAVHRLIQMVIRASMPAHERQQWLEKALAHLAEALACLPQEADAWTATVPFLPHVLAVAEHAMHLPATRPHAPRELALYVDLLPKLLVFVGYGFPEVQQIYRRIQDLSHAQDIPPQLTFRVYFWEIIASYLYATYRHNLQVCQTLWQLAEHVDADELRLETLMIQGLNYEALGELAQARMALEHCLRLYDVSAHLHRHTNLFGQDPAVASLSYLAHIDWLEGKPDTALRTCSQALELAYQSRHLGNQAFAHLAASMVYAFRQEYSQAFAKAEQVLACAERWPLPHWKKLATILHTCAQSLLASSAEARVQLRQEVQSWAGMGLRGGLPFFWALVSESALQAGDFDTAQHGLHEARKIMEETGERWWEAEVWRLQGVCLLRQSPVDAEHVEALFQQALQVARQQQARMLALRAAVSLGQLWHAQGKQAAARALLWPLVQAFAEEGTETVDYQQAQALVEALQG